MNLDIMRTRTSVRAIAVAVMVLACWGPLAATALALPIPAGAELWLKADAGVSTSGGDVITWADQSGNSRDADGTGHAPQYVLSMPALKGQPTIRFDGSSEYLKIGNQILPTTTDEMTILAVARADTNSSVSIVGIRGASRPLIQLDQDSSGKARFIVRDSDGTTLNSTELTHTGGYGIYAGTLSKSGATSTATVSFGGAPGNSPTTTALGTIVRNPPTLDQRIGGVFSGVNYHWQGDIAEVIVYDRALSSAEMDQAGYYLQGKYGVAWNLPANGRELWLRADAGVTTNASGMVTRWDDVSGNGRYAVADRGVGPQLVPSEGAANGLPTLRFNGTDERMGIVTRVLTGLPEEYTIFAVAKADRNNNPSILGLRTSVPFLQLDQDAAGHARFIVRNASSSATANAVGGVHTGDYGIYTAMMTNSGATSTANIYFDGLLEGTASANFGGPINFNVQQRIGGTDGIYYWQGDIAELLVYNRALSDSERSAVESYLHGKYTPEPATMTLLAMGGLGMLIRRRRRGERG